MHRARVNLFDESACAVLHEATLRVLVGCGVEVRHQRALELLKDAGARIEGTRVHFDRALVEGAIESTPKDWTMPSRGGGSCVRLKDGCVSWGTGPDNLYVHDPNDGRRRRAQLRDVESMASLCEQLPHVDWVMSMALPEDVPQAALDLYQFAAMLAGTRKPIIASTPFDGSHMRAMYEMAGRAGDTRSFGVLTMSSPPLMHDHEAVDKQLVSAELEIPVILAPAPTCGTGTPMSLTANLVVCNAEVLSCLVYHQLAKPGAPFVYGAGPGIMNMRTAVDLYGSPDCYLGYQGSVELGRYYGLPTWSYSSVTDAKIVDEQMGVEYGLSTILGTLSGATLLHDVGYLESGFQSSHESVLLGNELISWAKSFTRELSVDEEALQVDAIISTGPGGNHLADRYTREHRKDFWHPSLLDQNVFEKWQAEGARTLGERLHDSYQELRAMDHEPPLSDAERAGIFRLAEQWKA